jgi:uncharacterized protein with von Willebrand factor type A (vWA) domain
MTAINEVQVVLCIDASGSMQTYHYMDAAITDSNIFVNIMLPNDAVGVVSFKDKAAYVYDNGANPPKVKIMNGAVWLEAAKAISSPRA